MPKISIILPVYNTAKFLPKCLDSLINQTFKNFEIICIDDGSTDNSINIIETYIQKDPRIKLLKSSHSGVGNARNLGAKTAKGDYIQFLDSDDFFELDMLEKMYTAAQLHNADIVACSAKYVSENNEILNDNNSSWPINKDEAILNQPFSWQDCPEKIFTMFAPEPWMSLYKKDFYLKNKLEFPSLSSSNGACLGLMARILAGKIVLLDSQFINYRFCRKDSITYPKTIMRNLNMLKQRLTLKAFLIEQGVFENLKDSWYTNFETALKYIISNTKDAKLLEVFKAGARILLHEDWARIEKIFDNNNITFDTITRAIGSQKVFLWGASLQLEKILSQTTEFNPNILGIIDKNSARWGEKISKYTIYSPNILKETNAEAILLTIVNNNKNIYSSVKKYLQENHPDIKLLPQIFA